MNINTTSSTPYRMYVSIRIESSAHRYDINSSLWLYQPSQRDQHCRFEGLYPTESGATMVAVLPPPYFISNLPGERAMPCHTVPCYGMIIDGTS